MDLEDELSRMLSDSTAGLATPVHTIIAEATRRGRVLRRRRRLGIAATVLAVAGLAGGGTLIGLPGPPTRTTALATTPAPTAASASPTPPAPLVPTPDSMIKLLSDWLPSTASITDYQPAATLSNEFETQYGFMASVVDHQSPSTVRVQLSSHGTVDDPLVCPGGPRWSDPDRPVDADPAGCEVSKLPDGGTLRVEVSATDPNGVYDYDLTAVYHDGTALEITAWNATYHPPGMGAATRTKARPPFGVSFWTGVAMSDKWDYPLTPGPTPTPSTG